MKNKASKYILISILAFIVVFIGGFLFWALSSARGAGVQAQAALTSTDEVEYTKEDWFVFDPLAETQVGVIFYPGGLVEPEAYAPALAEIAKEGYLVVIAPMPLNLAVFNINAAEKIIAAYPEIEIWIISGHSLGGSMAAAYADQNPDLIDGIAFWASYPADNNDLSDQPIQVLSIYGTEDGLNEDAFILEELLPENTSYVAIEGGNHAQFGDYGEQEGDNPPLISWEAQQAEIVENMLIFLDQFSNN